MFVIGEIASEGVGVALHPVVQLATDRSRELVDERDEVDERQPVDAILEHARELIQQLDVGVDLAFGIRTLHLDDDLVAARQPGTVDLADRGRRDRLFVELEDLLDGEAELRLNDTTDVDEGLRPGAILKPAQLLDDVGRHDVRTGREQLPELDERRSELVEHVAQSPALGPGHVRGVGVGPARRSAEQLAEPVARGDLRNLTDARACLAPLRVIAPRAYQGHSLVRPDRVGYPVTT